MVHYLRLSTQNHITSISRNPFYSPLCISRIHSGKPGPLYEIFNPFNSLSPIRSGLSCVTYILKTDDNVNIIHNKTSNSEDGLSSLQVRNYWTTDVYCKRFIGIAGSGLCEFRSTSSAEKAVQRRNSSPSSLVPHVSRDLIRIGWRTLTFRVRLKSFRKQLFDKGA